MIRNAIITAALGLSVLTQTPAVSAQETPSVPPAARIDPQSGGLVANIATLEINFTDIAEAKGQIMLALFDGEESFNRGGKPIRAVVVPVTGPTATVTIPNILHGRYGFKIVHDTNGDGTMTTNPFGMPVEPFAFSNNAVGNMGPATWEAAAFDVTGPTTQTIRFR